MMAFQSFGIFSSQVDFYEGVRLDRVASEA